MQCHPKAVALSVASSVVLVQAAGGPPSSSTLMKTFVDRHHAWLAGYDALGFISCTGTNFMVRASALREVGGSPTYTLTEDFALGMALKMHGWHCRYVQVRPTPLACLIYCRKPKLA